MTETNRTTDEPNRTDDDVDEEVDTNGGAVIPRVPSDTVGTGSYIALSCTVIAVLATVILIAGLLISRWLF